MSLSAKWVQDNVEVTTKRLPGGVLSVDCIACFPLSAEALYELITHPENYCIYRNIKRCTYRKILSNDGRGHHLVDVENESEWHLAFFHGNVRTRMAVEQDMTSLTLQFTLAPGSHSPMMRDFYGKWTLYHMDASQLSAPSGFEGLCREPSGACVAVLHQRFAPRNLPLFLRGAFDGFVVKQMKNTFEDLHLEINRIAQGRPSLGPYMAACMREIKSEEGFKAADPDSVLVALEQASAVSSASFGLHSLAKKHQRTDVDAASPFSSPRPSLDLQHSRGSPTSSSGYTTVSAADMAFSSHNGITSHPLYRWGSSALDLLSEFPSLNLDAVAMATINEAEVVQRFPRLSSYYQKVTGVVERAQKMVENAKDTVDRWVALEENVPWLVIA